MGWGSCPAGAAQPAGSESKNAFGFRHLTKEIEGGTFGGIESGTQVDVYLLTQEVWLGPAIGTTLMVRTERLRRGKQLLNETLKRASKHTLLYIA